MEIKEQLETINKVPISDIAKILGITRQAVHQRIKKQTRIDELYQASLCILNGVQTQKNEMNNKLKEENISLKKTILELKNKNSVLNKETKLLKQELSEHKKYDELKQKYIELLHRYNALSDIKLLEKAGKPIQRKCIK